jgi:iron(III) transport system permease protein
MQRPSRIDSGSWLAPSAILCLLVLAPIAALGLAAIQGSEDLWRHLVAYVLPVAVRDTLVLLAGVGFLVATIGTSMAWLVTAYDFRGRRVIDWALLLPLAVPTYIIAYAYLDILHPVGPVQTALRALLGIDSPRELRLPDVRSMAGCVALLSFVLYPYVYLTTRAMFLMQTANLVEVSRTLGASRSGVFFRVALPMARPAVVIGVTLALLEALNDIGASEFMGVRTLTVSIYVTWVTRSDLPGAAQMALAMLALVLLLLVLERRARAQRQYANDAQHPRPLEPHRLSGWTGAAALAVSAVPIAIGFVIPAVYLFDASLRRLRFAGISSTIVFEAVNTIAISILATSLILGAGIAVAYTTRIGRGGVAPALARVASLGYALPGTVLAIGLLPVIGAVETVVDAATRRMLGMSSGLFLLGTGAAIVYAYLVRFLAIASGGIEAGFNRISLSLDDAAQTLGETAAGRLRRIHLPLLRPALATTALLVFVDCMKELPATLLLRPLGFETLATHLYGEAVRGTYEEAAIAALMIVMAGLVPVLLLARISRSDPSELPSH